MDRVRRPCVVREAGTVTGQSRVGWKWTSEQVAKKTVNIGEFAEGIGRLGFATSVLESEKPFLSPLYAFISVHAAGALVRLPLFVILNLLWIGTRICKRRAAECAVVRTHHGQLFRVDARA